MRAKMTTRWRVLKNLGKDDEFVEFDVSSQARESLTDRHWS
jgi:hypothetical protein